MKRALFSADGSPSAFYDTAIHGAGIPADAVAISDAQWLDFVSHPGRRKWQGGAVVEVAPAAVQLDLGAVKTALRAQVDADAAAARLKYITAGAGQAMEYQAVTTEAERIAGDQAPVLADYPMLAASIGIDLDPQTGAPATDLQGAARSVMAAAAQWSAVGAEIRRVRLAAKDAIGKAPDETAARLVAASVAWP